MTKNNSFAFLIVLLAGCAAPTPYLPGPTAHTEVKPGSILQLNKTITIPARSAGIRIQNGKIIEGSGDACNPNCRFEVRDPAKTNQDTQPDDLTITQVGVEYFQVSAGETTNMRTNFFLNSEKQPHIYRSVSRACPIRCTLLKGKDHRAGRSKRKKNKNREDL